nr:MAG TPA: hypothetical protein [Microviridae sp.]
MITLLMSLRDLKAEQYGKPFTAITVGTAARDIQDMIGGGDKNNMLVSHPADFDLYHIGNFDDEAGEITAHQPTHRILNCGSLVQKDKP